MKYNEAKLKQRPNGYYNIEYYEYTRHGKKRIWESLGTKEAEKASQLFQEKTGQISIIPGNDLTLDELITRYEIYGKTTFTPQTLKTYKLSLKLFKGFIGKDFPIRNITKSKVLSFIDSRRDTISNARKDLTIISSLFSYALERELITVHPCRGIKKITLPEKMPVFFTQEQIDLLTSKAEQWLADIITFAVNTGLREGEICNLKWKDITMPDKDGNRCVIINNQTFLSKSKRIRSIPLNQKADKVLYSQVKHHKLAYIFYFYDYQYKIHKKWNRDNLSHYFKQLLRDNQFDEKFNFHSLRHTFASHLAQKGVSLQVIQKLLGHVDARTTQIYAHLIPENLDDAVNRL